MTILGPSKTYEEFFTSLPDDFGTIPEVTALLARKRENLITLRQRPSSAERTQSVTRLETHVRCLAEILAEMQMHNVSLKRLIAGHNVCDCFWEKPDEVALGMKFCREIQHFRRTHPGEVPSLPAPHPQGFLARLLGPFHGRFRATA